MNNSSEPRNSSQKASTSKSIISYAILLIILILVGWGIWHLTHKSTSPTQATTKDKSGGKGNHQSGGNGGATVVGIAKVQQQNVASSIQALGTVTSSNTVVVHPQISGVLMNVSFKEGSFVRKGQVLAQIDDRAAKVGLLQSQGQLLKDQALLTNAKLDLQRYAQLWKQDSIAKQQYDTQASLVKQYEGVVKTDQADVDNAQLQLSYTRVTAPVDGRIGLRQVDVGNMVNTSDVNGIANITQLKNISVVFAVPEQYLTQLMHIMDDPQQVIPIEAWDRQNTQKLADGKLLALDNQVNTATGTINIKATFNNLNQHLFPNQFVNIHMQLGTISNALLVPTVALQLGANGSFVYKVNADQTVNAVNVKTGAVIGDNTVITEGAIQANDQVVVDGVDKLKDGAKISLGGGNHSKNHQHQTGSNSGEANQLNQNNHQQASSSVVADTSNVNGDISNHTTTGAHHWKHQQQGNTSSANPSNQQVKTP